MSAIREEELVENFRDYFEEETFERVKGFANDPNTGTYFIDLEELQQFDNTLFHQTLVDNPDKCLKNAELALEEVLGNDEFRLRLENPPEQHKTNIRHIRTDDINELMFVEGTISKSTDVQPKIEVATYECPDCGDEFEQVIPDEEMRAEPTLADCPNSDKQNHGSSNNVNMDLVMQESRMEDYQRMQLQESPEDMKGDNPKNIDITVTGDDIAGIATAGQKVTIVGILRVKQRDKKSAVLDRHIEGVNVELEEASMEDIEVTEEDIEKIEELSEDPDIYEKLAVSVEPTIYGYETERMGAVFQLFSGVKKEFKNAGDIRGNIHVLYVGDPGTGKSRILKYMAKLSPTGGIFTSGKGTSSAGITAAAVKDSEFGGDDKWTLKAGALVMADQGLACVDELDKMQDNDRSALHEGLEQQQISISKAGINATLNARCSLLAAANPKYGRFDEHEVVSEQINLEPALISRFDLIFIIQDHPEEKRDSNIADKILENNIKGQDIQQRRQEILKEEGADSMDEIYEDQEEEEVEVPVGKELFQKYIAYAQENYHPKLTPDAREKIRSKYVSIRQEGADRDVISLTARAIEAIVRLTEAAAKIRLSEEATVEHAETAIELYESYLQQVGIDPDTGEYDAGALESGTTETQRSRIKAVQKTIKELNKEKEEDEGAATKKEIIEVLEEKGFDPEGVESALGKLSRKGDIFNPAGSGEEKEYRVA